MHKISIKELIEYRRKLSDKSKRNFADKLKIRPIKETLDNDEGGGDYWITSTSCIYNVFKYRKMALYDLKINDLNVKLQATADSRIRSMYQRNIQILVSFKDFNFDDSRPKNIVKFETVHKVNRILTIDNFPLYVNPSLLFSHERNGKKELGAIWFVPKLYGFKKNELGMFCEVLYNFLIKHYSQSYQISEDLCIVVDTFNAQKVIYTELKSEEIPFLIKQTLNEIRKV